MRRLVILVALVVLSHSVARKERNAPHHHGGILPPYQPGPFSIDISPQEQAQLDEGQAVMKQTMPPKGKEDQGGGAICIQDVHAPLHAVWRQILDLDHYKGKVSKINECKNYLVSKQKDGTCIIKTKMVLGVLPGYAVRCHRRNGSSPETMPCCIEGSLVTNLHFLLPQYESYYNHRFCPKHNSLTWRLDYDKTSDFDDVSGHWHCEPHPTDASRTRVYYACDIKMKGNVPGPILNYISKQALKQATAWVKRESEQHPQDKIPAQFVTKDVLQPQ